MDKPANDTTGMNVIVGIPAYNEEKYIASVILLGKQYAREVIVVDDGSTDRTSRLAELAGATVVRHDPNLGYGAAIRRILSEAQQRNADILVILDADAQHNPDEIPSLVKAVAEGADVVIGARVVKGQIPAYRRFGQNVLARMANFVSGSKVSDTESGFRAYSRSAITTLELKEDGMAVSAEIVAAAANAGLKLAEVPISVSYDTDGSTLNPVSHGVGVMRRILNMISERRPMLFFSIFGLICLGFSLWFGVFVIRELREIQVLQTGSALLSMLFITVGLQSFIAGLILDTINQRLKRR